MDRSSSQQSVEDTDTSLPPPPPPPPWPSSPPDALSLYGIARRYCRERILVDPLHWTNRQLELLQISFSEPSLAPPPASQSILYHDYYKRVDCVRSLFEEEQGPFAVTPCYPVAAYIDRDFVEGLREKSVHLPKYSSSNLPMQAISRLQLKKIRPENPLKDPYIAALMVALAHNTWGHVEDEKPELLRMLKTYPSYVLTSSESAECMHLFKAELPSSLLDMFEFPNVAPPPWAPIIIQVFTIPFEPALTFRDRLSALIVPKNIDPSNSNPPNRDSFNRNPSDGNPSD
ncbi:hypothetical protein CFAM422_008331 [Trichoderma lentiforme]|uniref:Uncharacterized protein n=1 Tax=Trichoderma lentiforme TaxID=1567552 RepID=A0A9P4XBA7_9HYPO|nr:hypothetical protein CFAM422_008331 [Trichoderma lentiforme]